MPVAKYTQPRPCKDCRHVMGANLCSLVDDEDTPITLRTTLFQRSSGFVRDCGPAGVFWEAKE
jgi:hypothetical protein